MHHWKAKLWYTNSCSQNHLKCEGCILLEVHKKCLESACNTCIKEKKEEKLVVLASNTIADPWTMMIQFWSTFLAQWAVVTSWWLEKVTFFAIFESIEICNWKHLKIVSLSLYFYLHYEAIFAFFDIFLENVDLSCTLLIIWLCLRFDLIFY